MYKFVGIIFMISFNIVFAEIKVFPLQATPFNENIEIKIGTKSLLRRRDTIFVEYRSFPLGVDTYPKSFSKDFRTMKRNPEGTTILVIFNGRIRMPITAHDDIPMIEKRAYFNKELNKRIPRDIAKKLKKGKIVVSAIALNSFNESIKSESAIDTKYLDYMEHQEADGSLVSRLKEPYVLYNQPVGKYFQGEPVLLDFFLVNTSIAPNGNKVELYIDDKFIATLNHWIPYQIQNLELGLHKVKVVLVNANGMPYETPFLPQEAVVEIIPNKPKS